MDEKTYRHLLDETFARIDAAFEDVDPDLAEVSLGQGTLTIVYRAAARCILTPQPPVRQLWMAFRDRAWHFDYEPGARRWLDDRGQGIDLYPLVEQITREAAGASVDIKR